MTTPSPEPLFVGIQPRVPGFLNRWHWLLRPVAAERMAALRIAVAVAALIDIGIVTLPQFAAYYAEAGLGGPTAYESRFYSERQYWSLLRVLPAAWGAWALVGVWSAAAIALLIGARPLVSGLACWACAISFWNINHGLCNGGDQIRNALFLGVAFGRSGAVWGIESVRSARAAGCAGSTIGAAWAPDGDSRPVLVPGWPAKVLLVQLACVYVFSGVYKLLSGGWQTGYVMYFVNHDLEWCLTPNLSPLVPAFVHRLSSWVAVGWELAFPLLIAFRRTRAFALWLGVLFNVLTLLTLEVGHFATYSLAFYALFVPWESVGFRPEGPGQHSPGHPTDFNPWRSKSSMFTESVRLGPF